MRKADEVAGEAIAADVRGLPDPVGLELVGERVVERAAVARAAGVVLAVRADQQERVLDGLACPAGEVELEQVR